MFFVMSSWVQAAEQYSKILSIATVLDKSKMYNFDLLEFKLSPESVTLQYDANKKTFSDSRFSLAIQTNIPEGESVNTASGYQLTLEENWSSCYVDAPALNPDNLAVGYDDIATIYLDSLTGEAAGATGPFVVGTAKLVKDFNDKDTYKNSNHELIVTFSPVPKLNSNDDIRFCQGAFTVSFRLNI